MIDVYINISIYMVTYPHILLFNIAQNISRIHQSVMDHIRRPLPTADELTTAILILSRTFRSLKHGIIDSSAIFLRATSFSLPCLLPSNITVLIHSSSKTSAQEVIRTLAKKIMPPNTSSTARIVSIIRKLFSSGLRVISVGICTWTSMSSIVGAAQERERHTTFDSRETTLCRLRLTVNRSIS